MFLKTILATRFKLNTAILSIDDFYLTKQEREELAKEIHPLFKTRGVPGTHDVDLALKTIETLKMQKQGQSCQIPRFDKAIDDRVATSNWDSVSEPIDVIILEGWCVSLSAQTDDAVAIAVNDLERQEDSDGIWRNYVNRQLTQKYKNLFKQIDNLIVLKAPSFSSVFNWRLLQEQKLIEKIHTEKGSKIKQSSNKTMSPEEITRFISHYQRLTEHAIKTLPEKADWLLTLQDDHKITALDVNNTPLSSEN